MRDPSAGPVLQFRACWMALASGELVPAHTWDSRVSCPRHDWPMSQVPPRTTGACIRTYRQVDDAPSLPPGPWHRRMPLLARVWGAR
jgi:hypothetical protein